MQNTPEIQYRRFINSSSMELGNIVAQHTQQANKEIISSFQGTMGLGVRGKCPSFGSFRIKRVIGPVDTAQNAVNRELNVLSLSPKHKAAS